MPMKAGYMSDARDRKISDTVLAHRVHKTVFVTSDEVLQLTHYRLDYHFRQALVLNTK